MHFDLECTFTLSKPVEARDDVEAFLASFVQEANDDLLQRGARDCGADITDWTLHYDRVDMRIVSTGNIRSHEGALRIKKALAQQLGQQFHIGVRDLLLRRYVITMELDPSPVHATTIPFAELSIDGATAQMVIENRDESFLRNNYVDRMVNLVQEKSSLQHYEGKKEYWEQLWRSPEKEPIWHRDPSEEMQERGWITLGETKGKWFYYPPAAAVMRTLERLAIEEVVTPLGFKETIEPMHVSLDTWLSTGHLEGMPQEMYYTCEPATRDTEAWERFIDLVKITREVPTEELQRNLKSVRAGVCYAQCPNMYAAMAGKTIADSSLPILLFDRSVPSNRYESGGRHGIERVDEFHRIEILYIGTKKHLLELRERLMERYRHVFSEVLDLEWRMARVAPFYLQQAGIHDEAQADQGTIDFEVWLPYRGDRDHDWLEIQNISIVGDKYTEAFNIKGQTADLWSGCSGIGLERWMVAFLAQKGLDPAEWPDDFKQYLPELPGMPEFL